MVGRPLPAVGPDAQTGSIWCAPQARRVSPGRVGVPVRRAEADGDYPEGFEPGPAWNRGRIGSTRPGRYSGNVACLGGVGGPRAEEPVMGVAKKAKRDAKAVKHKGKKDAGKVKHKGKKVKKAA